MISLKLNHQHVSAKRNQTILAVAREKGVDIPTLCHMPRHSPRSVCRLCVVEVGGANSLVPACSTTVSDGMEIFTHSDPVLRARGTLMEFILAENRGLRPDEDTQVKRVSREIGVDHSRFTLPPAAVSPAGQLASEYLDIDLDRCIHCDRCIRVCETRQVISRSGFGHRVVNSFCDGSSGVEGSQCTYCGDWVAACPAGGINRRV
jgi:NADH dehydrogenase/NADH:ubiquinone oxidoreductase subunit G